MSSLDLFAEHPAAPPPRARRAAAPFVPRAGNPYVVKDRTALSLSGGRTSAFLLHQVLEANGGVPDCLQILFANTGLEHPATLDFVHEIGQRWSVPITWVEYRNDEAGFAVVDHQSASRDGEPYEAIIRKRSYLPNPITRFCTSELKIRAMHKRLRTLGWADDEDGWDQLIGIRADEPRRVAKIRQRGVSTESVLETMRMPLAEAGVGKADVGAFWRRQPFDLQLPNENGVTRHGNCVLCFLKPGAQVLSLIREEPARATWWIRQERETAANFQDKTSSDGWRFRNDRPSYAEMQAFALAQDDLFRRGEQAEEAVVNLMALVMADTEGIDCFCGDDG